MLINISQYPTAILEPEERDYWGVLELDAEAPDLPLTQDDAFDLIEGKTFAVTWPDDEFLW